MSGFVAVLNTDGSPIDVSVFSSLTDSLAFRGPDAQKVWCSGPIGLGHALLRTTRESENEWQPFSLDERVWIVADARVDARKELVQALSKATGNCHAVSLAVADVELILRAYLTWGQDCINHFIGDFAFVIWDASRHQLFAARDHFGVKPLLYANVAGKLIISNTLDCVRQHPDVSDRLNDQAIADFLLFDINKDAGTTSLKDVQRLPAAHLLMYDKGRTSVRRYWAPGAANAVRLKDQREHIEYFQTLLDEAVTDRLRSDSVGLLMSGGLDSTAVAVAARRAQARKGHSPGVLACTAFVAKLVPDDEPYFAKLAAAALGIPIEFQSMDGCSLFEGAALAASHSHQPEYLAWPDYTASQLLRMVGASRIVLTGQGSDPGLSSRISLHFRQLIQQKRFGHAIFDAWKYLRAEGRMSRLYLRSRWRSLIDVKNPFYTYPPWLNKDLERELCLRERWQAHAIPDRRAAMRYESQFASTSFRPEAIASISHVSWPNVFESFDAGVTRIPVEVRHPFFDLRLVTFLLGLDRLPWCSDKELLRQSTRGVLPDSVRLRRKSPMHADAVISLLQRSESEWVDHFAPDPGLQRYVIRKQIPAIYLEKRSWAAWLHLKPLSLNFWLQGIKSSRIDPVAFQTTPKGILRGI